MGDLIRSHRNWLKDSIRKTVDWNATGQSRGLPPPPAQKTVPPNARTVALPGPDRFDSFCTTASFGFFEAAEASGDSPTRLSPLRNWRSSSGPPRGSQSDTVMKRPSAEAIGAGVCAVAAYDQEALDAFLHLDGEEEFVIYLAPVGKHDISA